MDEYVPKPRACKSSSNVPAVHRGTKEEQRSLARRKFKCSLKQPHKANGPKSDILFVEENRCSRKKGLLQAQEDVDAATETKERLLEKLQYSKEILSSPKELVEERDTFKEKLGCSVRDTSTIGDIEDSQILRDTALNSSLVPQMPKMISSIPWKLDLISHLSTLEGNVSKLSSMFHDISDLRSGEKSEIMTDYRVIDPATMTSIFQSYR